MSGPPACLFGNRPRPEPVEPPRKPRAGLRLWLHQGPGPYDGEPCPVVRVNTKSFYVRSAVGRERHPVGAWPRWLADRMSSGELFIDGHPASKPGWLPSATAGQVQAPKPVDPEARELRFLRAANEVLKHYERERRDNARTAEIHVRGGSRDYLVTAQTDWSRPPRCTCPDATHSTHLHNGYCKHVVAVLLENEDLRGQLIEIFL